MTTVPIIEAVHVTKKYGRVTAVDDLSLSIPQGVCFGLLGPNGAGKTTLIEIIEDIIAPTSGHVRFKGGARTATFREKIGIMFQHTALLGFMTVAETLGTFQALYHETESIDHLLALCHLGEIRNQLNDRISGGQRQRLLLALALINKPHLLFLDEPSTGLDPQTRRNLWDIIDTIKGQKKTIILTTHYMDEAQELCDRVAIVDHGQVIAQGTPADLIEQHTEGVTLSFPKGRLERVAAQLPFKCIENKDRTAIQVGNMNRAVQQLLEYGVDLAEMTIQTANLETVFLNLTGRRLRE
jgi:ABC-2 type transport system ATP-binding protein